MFTLPFTYFGETTPSVPERYWVPGGSGNWNNSDTNNWSLTSGGPSGASVPSAITNAIWDANSGSGTVSKTTGTTCRDLNFENFTGTFNGTGALSLAGSIILGAGMTNNFSGATTAINAGAKTIKLNGKQWRGSISINTSGVNITLLDAFNSTSSFSLNNGSLDTNNQSFSVSSFTKNPNGAASLGSTTMTIGVFCNIFGGAGAWNAGSSTIAINGQSFGTSGNLSFNEIQLTSAFTNIECTGSFTCNTLRMSNTGGYPYFSFNSDFTVNTLMQCLGANSTSNRALLKSGKLDGSPITITCGTGAPTLSNFDLMGINASGFTPWTGTSIGDGQGNSNITFTTPVTRYLVMSADASYMDSVWSTSSGGSTGASPPLLQDTVIIDTNSVSTTGLTFDLSMYRVPSLDFSNVLNAPIISSGADTVKFYGDYIVHPTVQSLVSGSFEGYGITQVLDVPNTFSSGSWTINCRNAGEVLSNDLYYPSQSLTINNGVFNQGVNNITFGVITCSSSGTWTKSGDANIVNGDTPVLTIDPAATINDTGGTITLDNNVDIKTLSFGGHTFNNVYLKIGGAGSECNIDAGNTFNDFKIDPNCKVNFLTSININTFDAVGTLGNTITLDSVDSNPWDITSLSGTTVNADYLILSNSVASGATFNATNSIDGGGNSGWNITDFIPSDISDLKIWLDANDPANNGTQPADGSDFDTWIDRSLSSMDFTSPSSLFNHCIFNTNQQNGLPAVSFDGLNSWMGSVSSINTIDYTMFVVAKTNNVVNETYYASNGSTKVNGAAVMAVSPSALNGMSYGPSTFVEDGSPDTNPHVFMGMWDGSITTFSIDGTNQVVTNDTTAPTTPSGQSWLGTDNTFLTTLNGQIYEVAFFARGLSTDEVNQMIAYFKNKWGL